MDLHNNEVSRAYNVYTANMTAEMYVMDMVNSGKLVYLGPLGPDSTIMPYTKIIPSNQ